MKRKETFSVPAVGGTSLMVIFAVLCLTVFALLSVHTAQAEKRLSDKAARAVAAYYRADLEAEQVFARLRAGENVEGVQHSGDVYCYSIPVSGNQTLWVELRRIENSWQVCRWQTAAWVGPGDSHLPVWDGK